MAATTTMTSALRTRPRVRRRFMTLTYLSYIMDDTSRISGMAGASYANFQVPNTPGLQNDPANFSAPGGNPWTTNTNFDSATLNENQNEQNYYGVVAYQKPAGDFNMKAAAFGRVSTVHFPPDPGGALHVEIPCRLL